MSSDTNLNERTICLFKSETCCCSSVFLSFKMEIYDSRRDKSWLLCFDDLAPLFILVRLFRLFSDYRNKAIFGATIRNSVRKEFSHITKHQRDIVREWQHSINLCIHWAVDTRSDSAISWQTARWCNQWCEYRNLLIVFSLQPIAICNKHKSQLTSSNTIKQTLK